MKAIDREPEVWWRLARAALTVYGLTGARLRPLRGLKLRGVFQVDTWEGDARTRFVLRIHGPDENRTQLRSVLDWLVALRRDTDLGVPEPVAAPDGAFLVEIPDPLDGNDQPGRSTCELLRWLEGRVPSRTFSHEMLARLGAFTAGLHEHTMHFVPPPGFSRPSGDADAILRGEKRMVPRLRQVSPSPFAAGEISMLDDAEARLRKTYRRLPRNRSSFGLMHGDLHPRNLLFHRGAIRAIDFEGCGDDFFLYDLASSLVEGTAGWEILASDPWPGVAASLEAEAPAFASRRDALLRGYASVRPLPEGAEQLSTFIAVRALSSLPWLADWAAHGTDDGWTRMVLDARVRFLGAYVREGW